MTSNVNINILKLNDIKPYWRNPRKNEKAVEAVKQSIQDYGFNQTILVDSKKVIIAGHTRYKALLELGWTEAPCIVLDLSSAKAKEYRIADNKTSELSEWDMSALIPELRELEALENMQIFFEDINLDSLLKETSSIADITSAQIEKQFDQLESRFKDASDNVQKQYVDITCPHCRESFFLDRAELNRQPGVEKVNGD